MYENYELSQTMLVWEDYHGYKKNKREQGFVCKHCGNYVTTHMLFSGVQNRNHCPYCLWSRHLDLYAAGDRLAACKAQMQPVGLALKQAHNKYAKWGTGELMLIHQCTDCGKLSANRIAADDDAATLMEVYEGSLAVSWQLDGLHSLTAAERTIIWERLYGTGNTQ